MLFGIFSRCDSMGEVCDGMRALGGKLNYLGLDCSPAKSTAGDALRDRDEELFRLFYFALIAWFSPFLSVSRKKKHRKEGVCFDEFYASDSSTITLFSDIMKGVGHNPKDGGKKKGGLKVYMLTDIHSDTPQFVKISEAKMHNKNFLQYLNLPEGSMVVFDKAYNYYLQFAKWTETGVNFVCRLMVIEPVEIKIMQNMKFRALRCMKGIWVKANLAFIKRSIYTSLTLKRLK